MKKAVVDYWNSILDEKIKEIISDPNEVIYRAMVPLDGTDTASRSIQTNLGKLITRGMAAAYPNEIDMVIVNGGSLRLDDKLKGDVTSIDLFRVMPFGGEVLKVRMKGALLKKVLDYGESQSGTGAYLQRMFVSKNAKEGPWLCNGNVINDTQTYTVAMSDYLMKGFDIPFLTPENPDVVSVYKPSENELGYDIRKAVIVYLKSLK